jgi:multidrug efflux pump subunit AcrA (membrane-fusion protein)
MSYARTGQVMQHLDLEVAALLRKAEAADTTPLADGLTIPAEVQRRQERKAKLAQARAEMETRAYARAQAERADYEAKLAARAAVRAQGKKPRGKEPPPPDPTPGPKEQYNFTDPESRIMKAGNGNHFEQAYNAQAAVEVDSRLIVGERVCTAANDKQQLVPTLAAVRGAAGPVKEILVDSGFVSEAAVTAVETDAPGRPAGITVLAALARHAHGRTVAGLEKKPEPAPPPSTASFAERMRHRTATHAGRQRYKLRQQTVEPVFGIIKAALGFRRFSLRGAAKVALEWTLLTLAYNLKRLHTLKVTLAPA